MGWRTWANNESLTELASPSKNKLLKNATTAVQSGTYTNTIVLQHHNVVLTKADKVYHVRCTYETASRNVSFGMMPVK